MLQIGFVTSSYEQYKNIQFDEKLELITQQYYRVFSNTKYKIGIFEPKRKHLPEPVYNEIHNRYQIQLQPITIYSEIQKCFQFISK